MLVVDEIQNVERVAQESDERAKVLYDTLIEFRHQEDPDKIIIAGPRVENIDNLAIEIFGEDAQEEETKNSPVISITYSIAKKGKQYVFKQYSGILAKPQEIKIENNQMINGFGQRLYNDNFHEYLRTFLRGLGDAINIIFSPNPNQARKTAEAIYDILLENHDPKLQSLEKYIKKTVHPDYSLCNTLEHGVAYHHGRLPHHVRRVLEKAISEKLITNVVCTTTLMQGMNLPAQNVIIRNPNLFVKQTVGAAKLSEYEIANLRGRAGRLLKDFIGRTYILDESAFEVETSQQQNLFDDATKELRAGYSEKYEQYKGNIISSLLNEETPAEENRAYAYFLPYIRQMTLKYGINARRRLEAVGINVPLEDFTEIVKSMRTLKVPKEVCVKNRYWDPLDLNMLFKNKQFPVLPFSVRERDIAKKLEFAVQFMQRSMPFYYNKYFKIIRNGGFDPLLSLCINAENWLKETPLSVILDTDYHDDSDKIEKTIGELQGKISYDLTALLKPLYDISVLKTSNNENMFLNFIEVGAYKPVTRKLIEMGIPRETAILLNNKYLDDLNNVTEDISKKIFTRIGNIYSQLSYWDKAQLESIIAIGE